MLRLGGPGSRPRVLGADLGDTDPAPLLPNISEYDFGRREGQGHLNTFPAGVPSPRSSNGAVFGIANASPVKHHHPLPTPLDIRPTHLLQLALVSLDC